MGPTECLRESEHEGPQTLQVQEQPMLEKNRHRFNATEQRLPDLNMSNSVNKRSSVELHQGIGEEFFIGSITGVLPRDDA